MDTKQFEGQNKIYAINAIMDQSDDFILWFTDDRGAFCFMADRDYSWNTIVKDCYYDTLLLSQAKDLENLLSRCSDSQHVVKGTAVELQKIIHKAERVRAAQARLERLRAA